MTEQQTQLKAADTILRKGVRVPIVSAPLLFRIVGIRRLGVTIRQPSMGGLILIGRLVAEMGLKPGDFRDLTMAECHRMIARHGDKALRILSIGVLRYWPLVRLERPLARWLRWRIEPSLLAYAIHLLLALSDAGDFTVSIRSLTQRVSFLSPRTQGSQQPAGSPD